MAKQSKYSGSVEECQHLLEDIVDQINWNKSIPFLSSFDSNSEAVLMLSLSNILKNSNFLVSGGKKSGNESTATSSIYSQDDESLVKKHKFPSQTFLIVAMEACERMCYYGTKSKPLTSIWQ